MHRLILAFCIAIAMFATAAPASAAPFEIEFSAEDHPFVGGNADYLGQTPAEFVNASNEVHYFLLAISQKLAVPGGGCSLGFGTAVPVGPFGDGSRSVTSDLDTAKLAEIASYYCMSDEQALRSSVTLLVFLSGINANQLGQSIPLRPLPEPVSEIPAAVDFAGVGDTVLQLEQRLDPRQIVFALTHEGTSNFIVTLFDADGERIGGIANEIGAYQGAVVFSDFFDTPADIAAIEVAADGAWTINVDAAQMSNPNVAQATDTAAIVGSGDSVILLPAAAVGATPVVRLTHDGTSNFIVTSHELSGERLSGLANEIGTYDGTVYVSASDGLAEIRVLDVQADGAWSISFGAADASNPNVIAQSGSSSSGSGDAVVVMTTPTSALVTATLTHDGSRNFIIWTYTATDRDLLLNEIGAFNGMRVVAPGTVVLDVTADGTWTVTLS